MKIHIEMGDSSDKDLFNYIFKYPLFYVDSIGFNEDVIKYTFNCLFM